MTQRHAATVAPDDAIGGGFLLLHAHELDVLATLPLWTLALFVQLLRLVDFKTGAGCTTVPQLVRALQPLQPARGRRHFAPDAQAVIKAIRELEARRILARDKGRSRAENLLFFTVAPRVAKVRPGSKLDPLKRTPVDKPRASNGAASRAV